MNSSSFFERRARALARSRENIGVIELREFSKASRRSDFYFAEITAFFEIGSPSIPDIQLLRASNFQSEFFIDFDYDARRACCRVFDSLRFFSSSIKIRN